MSNATPGHRGDPAAVELSDVELLLSALQEATDAHRAGELAAPWGVNELALRRAERHARRSDAAAEQRVAEVAA